MIYGQGFVCLCVIVQVCVQLILTLCARAVADGSVHVCVCGYVISHVWQFELEQWHMGVCICVFVCVCAQSCPTLCTGAVAYGCVCVCVHSCPTLCTGAVADGCVCVCACVCAPSFPTLCTEQWHMGVWVCVNVQSHVGLFVPEQWHMAVCVFLCVCANSVLSSSLRWSSGGWLCVCS